MSWPEDFYEATRRGFPLRPTLSGSAWADAFRIVPAGTSPEPGPWKTSRAPYLREPLDAATDRDHQIIVLMLSSQVGKSEVLLNTFGYFAAQYPSSQLMLQPTVDVAKSFSRERIEPTIRATPALSSIIDTAERVRGQAVRRKDFPGGYLAIEGTNSPAGLSSRPIRVLLADEVDRYTVTREGDPLSLAIQRTANYYDKKIILSSTPSVAGASCIESWYLRGDRREYRVRCPHCGEAQALYWGNVRWDRDLFGRALPDTARIECESCGRLLRDSGLISARLLSSGAWHPTSESSEGIVSYHLSALYSPWVSLASLVSEFDEAIHSPTREGLREFVNLKLGEPWDESAYTTTEDTLCARAEPYTPDVIPCGAVVLTAGVDVQRDRLEASIFGWGIGKESWGVEHRVFFGAPDTDAVWRDLAVFLSRQRIRADGVALPVSCTFVDSGDGATSADVYRFCRAHEADRAYAIKGRGGAGVPVVLPSSRRNAFGVHLIVIGVDAAKASLAARLRVSEVGPGFVHFAGPAQGFGPEYYRQLTAEVLARRRVGGVMRVSWRKIRERNEALDCAVYAAAAIELLHPDFELLAGMLRQSSKLPASSAAHPHRRRGSQGVML